MAARTACILVMALSNAESAIEPWKMHRHEAAGSLPPQVASGLLSPSLHPELRKGQGGTSYGANRAEHGAEAQTSHTAQVPKLDHASWSLLRHAAPKRRSVR